MRQYEDVCQGVSIRNAQFCVLHFAQRSWPTTDVSLHRAEHDLKGGLPARAQKESQKRDSKAQECLHKLTNVLCLRGTGFLPRTGSAPLGLAAQCA